MDLNFYNNFVPQTAKYDDQKYTSRGEFYTLHIDSEIIQNNIKKLNDTFGAPFVYSDYMFYDNCIV